MTVFELMAVLGINTTAYEKGLADAKGAAEGFAGKVGGAVNTVATATKTAMVAGGAAVGAFGLDATKTAMNFDTSMSQVVATMGYGVDELHTAGSEASNTYKQLSDFAQQMGASTKFSASESADALNFMALAGYDAQTSMEMLPNVLNLAAAGSMELADASDMVTDAQSALGLSLDETSQLVDKMAAASSKSNTSVSQLGSAILTVGGTAKNLAGGTTELATALGLLADNGIKSSEGGTALRNIILSLSAPTEKAASLMEELGLQVFDAQGNMRPLQDIFEDLNGTLSTMTQGEQTQVLSELFNKVDLKSVNALMATNSERWAELSGAIEDSAGAAKNMADVQLDNLAGDITILGSAWEGFQIAASKSVEGNDKLRGGVQLLSDSLSRLTTAINSDGLMGGLKELGNIGGELYTKITEGIQSKLEYFASSGTDIINKISEGVEKAIPVFIENWAKTWSLIATGITDNLPALLETGGKIVTKLAEGITEAIPIVRQAVVDILGGFSSWIAENLGSVIESGLQIVVGFTSTLRENAGQMIEAGLNLLVSLAQGIADGLPALIENIPDIVSNIAGIINDNAPKILEAGIKIIVTLGMGLIQAIPTLIANIPEIIKAIFDAFMAFNWLNLGSSIIKTIGNGIKNVFTHIPDLMEEISTEAVNKVKAIDWVGLGKHVIETIVSGIRALFGEIPNLLRSIGDNGLNLFRSIDWMGLGRSVIQFIASGINALFGNIPGALVNIARNALSSFLSVNWGGVGRDVIQGIVNGLWNNAGAVVSTIQNIASNALDAIKSFFGISSPSKVMRDQVGKMMAEGIGIGFAQGIPMKEMRGSLQDALDTLSDVEMPDLDFTESLFDEFDLGSDGFGSGLNDEVLIDTYNDDEKEKRYPADNVTINVYAKENQDEKMIAEEVMRLFTLWDNQKKRVYA